MAPGGGGLREGALAALTGRAERLSDLKASSGEEFDAAGERVQLVRFDAQDRRWLAMTFSGVVVKVGIAGLRPLANDELHISASGAAPGAAPALDLVLGPGSDQNVVAQLMMSELAHKGYCLCHSIIPQRMTTEMVEAASHLRFNRVPAEFEPYYLGRDSREKTALVDFDSSDVPHAVADSPLAEQDIRMGSLCAALSPGLEELLGIRITSRTNLLIRQTFRDDDEEAQFPTPIQATDSEHEAFLSLMKRKRVCAVQFLGPLTGRFELISKEAGEGDESGTISMEAAPGLLAIFLTERFAYSHMCAEGATLTVQSWFLGQRPEFQIGDIGGDLEMLSGTTSGAEPPKGESVAVTGIATLLGADSKDFHCYWLMFAKAGGDTFVEVPITRWDINIYCQCEDMQAAQVQGLAYTKHQGYVDGIEMFDSRFFGISNTEAAAMDPNQRKTLEVTYEALNMGGYDLKTLQRTPGHIGCFVGISGTEWSQVPHAQDAAGCGGAEAIVSNRVNFSMNLKGASQTINTACSAGLVAMHTGKLHLKYKDFDPLEGVICCGINLAYSPMPFIGCCSGGMLSFKGRCFTFDISGDGYGRGEGCSAVFMKNQEYTSDIFALCAGSQANQDGRSASITAPNGPSQEKCIRAAFREAGLKPQEVDCFECHGTGTALGDPIEVGAFRRIYNAAARDHSLLVTSSKSNLGHLEGGAGMAGWIKCCLQVMRAEAAPNQHLRERNPHLDVEGFPAQFISEGLTCMYDSAYSGVSSFGFGGTNAHAMAYGKNNVTSRGIVSRSAGYYRGQMLKKLTNAPPADITMLSDNPEEWETNGMPVSEDHIGKIFQVEVQEDGKAIWREVVHPPPAFLGNRFYVSGTFNAWGMDFMKPDEQIPNLHAGEVVIGNTGWELFHIIADEDPGLVYFPRDTPKCMRRVEAVAGPEEVDVKEEFCWCLAADPGTRFRIEFVCAPHSISVNWIRLPQGSLPY